MKFAIAFLPSLKKTYQRLPGLVVVLDDTIMISFQLMLVVVVTDLVRYLPALFWAVNKSRVQSFGNHKKEGIWGL